MSTRPLILPVRVTPVIAGATIRRSMRSAPMRISNLGRIGPFRALGTSCGSFASVACGMTRRRISQPVAEPGEGRPAEFRARRVEHQPLGIAYPDVDQHRVRIERSLDPPDAEAQAVSGLHRRDPVGDPAMADAGVEQPRTRHHQRHQPQQRSPPAAATSGGAAIRRPGLRPSFKMPGRARRRRRCGGRRAAD